MEGIHIVSYDYAKRFLGREAAVHCRGGRCHYGVIRRVTPERLYVQPHPVGFVSHNEQTVEIDTLENRTDAELQTVQRRGIGYGGYGRGRAAVTGLALYDVLAISLFAW